MQNGIRTESEFAKEIQTETEFAKEIPRGRERKSLTVTEIAIATACRKGKEVDQVQ
jgi:hypothetical protein